MEKLGILPRHLERISTSEDIAEILAEYQLQAEEREEKKIRDEIRRAHGEDSGGKPGGAFGR